MLRYRHDPATRGSVYAEVRYADEENDPEAFGLDDENECRIPPRGGDGPTEGL